MQRARGQRGIKSSRQWQWLGGRCEVGRGEGERLRWVGSGCWRKTEGAEVRGFKETGLVERCEWGVGGTVWEREWKGGEKGGSRGGGKLMEEIVREWGASVIKVVTVEMERVIGDGWCRESRRETGSGVNGAEKWSSEQDCLKFLGMGGCDGGKKSGEGERGGGGKEVGQEQGMSVVSG